MSLEDAILVLAEAVQELTAAIGGRTSEPVKTDAPDPSQTSIRDFSKNSKQCGGIMDRSQGFRYYDKHRKGMMRCSRCGLVGYNIRTCDRHQDL